MFSDQGRLWKKWSKFLADQVEKPQLGHFALLKSYVGSLQNGSSPPVTGEDGRNAIKLLECIEKSLNEGTPVNFSSW
jgi:predicted dehydrogenase